jgi:hypothetical protein
MASPQLQSASGHTTEVATSEKSTLTEITASNKHTHDFALSGKVASTESTLPELAIGIAKFDCHIPFMFFVEFGSTENKNRKETDSHKPFPSESSYDSTFAMTNVAYDAKIERRLQFFLIEIDIDIDRVGKIRLGFVLHENGV